MKWISKGLYTFALMAGLLLFGLAIYYADKMYQLSRQEIEMTIPDYRYHLVLIPEEMDNDYWRLVEKGAKAAATQHKILLEYVGPKQGNIDEHLKQLNISIASKVDGVMTQGLNDLQHTPLINKLVDKGIPVVTVDTDAPNSKRYAYIGTDNYYAGFIAGKALISDTEGDIYVGIITGGFQSAHQQLRVQGFKDAIADEERIKITAIEESRITRIRAAEMAVKILSNHPVTNAFYGTSALDGIGIAQAVQQRKLEGKIHILAFDTIQETMDYINQGVIHATVVQKPYEMGYKAVETMIDILEGEAVANFHFTETRIVYKDDIVQRADLQWGEPAR